jgi:hypothetical protein
VDNSNWNNFMADDGSIQRIRDGQTAVCTAFGNLSIPAGATIDGIEVDMEGTALDTNHDAAVGGQWISVSNDGGSSFSTGQSITTGPWVAYPGTMVVETAGGTSELWGETWNATTAASIQVRFVWPTSNGDAVFFDYVKVRITYTVAASPPTKFTISSGTLKIKGGNLKLRG